MPGRQFHLGLDVAVLVGKPEHVALGVLLAPLCYLIALLIPGNRVLPLADAAGYMIFFTVWAVNTSRGNLFRGLLNSLLLWIPISIIIANAWVPATMTMVTATGFKLPVAAPQVTSLTTGSHFIGYALYQIMAFLGGVGSISGFFLGLAILLVFGLVWYAMRARPKAYAEELKQEAS
jgi:PTS system galactitol-specific IIC component